MNLTAKVLAMVPLFSDLDEKELEVLRHHLALREYLAGQTIFRLGDMATSCLLVLGGDVGVYLDNADNSLPVTLLSSGALVGQMSLIDGKRRSATCRVTSTTAQLIELQREDFQRLISSQTPFAYKILDKLVVDLVTRLRQTNERLVDAKREQTHAALTRKTRDAAARLMGGPNAMDSDDLDPDSIKVFVPSFDQRMRERRDK